ncbi:MAG TPA: hypothetical protein VGF67_28965 [Ktedonobacteraceae bacterium]|jgi:hypothetical protein
MASGLQVILDEVEKSVVARYRVIVHPTACGQAVITAEHPPGQRVHAAGPGLWGQVCGYFHLFWPIWRLFLPPALKLLYNMHVLTVHNDYFNGRKCCGAFLMSHTNTPEDDNVLAC